MKAVIYARQSSGDEEVSESVDMQFAKCRELAKKEGLEVIGEYSDLNTSGRTYPTGAESIAELDRRYQEWYDGQTGTKKYRPGLGQAIEKAVSEHAAMVIYDITRLYRPVSGTYLEAYISQRLAGVPIHSTKGSIDLGSFGDSLITAITNRINDDQLRTQKEKSIMGLRKLRDNGRYYGAAILGYRYDKNTSTYVGVEKELSAIRSAYQDYLAGIPVAEVCRRFDKAWPGRKAATGDVMMRRILRHPEYCGLTHDSQGELVPVQDGLFDVYPVSRADWHRVQTMIGDKTARAPRPKIYNYSLNGLVRCGYCGRSLIMHRSISNSIYAPKDGRTITTYKCPAGTGRGNECSYATIKYSIRDPVRIGVMAKYDDYDPDGLAGHGQRTLAVQEAERPEKNRISGIYEAVMPMLAAVCLKTIKDADKPERLAERTAMLKAEVAKAKDAKKGIAELIAKGLLSVEDAEKQLKDIADGIKSKESEMAVLESESLKSGRHAVQRTYARLEQIQKGTLHPDDFRELFLKVFAHIEVYDTYVEIVRLDGGRIRLQKNLSRNAMGMPQCTLGVHRYRDGRIKAVVKYYYNTAFVVRGLDDDEKTIYDSEDLEIITVGHCQSHSHHATSTKRSEWRKRLAESATTSATLEDSTTSLSSDGCTTAPPPSRTSLRRWRW